MRFYFIYGRVVSNKIKVEYMSTGGMLANILRRPLLGALFLKFRQVVELVLNRHHFLITSQWRHILTQYGIFTTCAKTS